MIVSRYKAFKINNKSSDEYLNALRKKSINWLIFVSFAYILLSILLFPWGMVLGLALFYIPYIHYQRFKENYYNYGGQYIEWTNQEIIYRNRDEDESIIPLSELKDAEVRYDDVILFRKDGSRKYFIMADYSDFDDRIKIKRNFEELMYGRYLDKLKKQGKKPF